MQDYNTIIGAIQMRQNNCSYSVIEGRYHIGSGTTQRILKRFEATGMTLEELRAMEPTAVEEMFYPRENLQRKDVPAGEIADVIKSSSEIIRNVAVKDIYFDKTFKENEYAVLYEVKYCSKDSTLTAEQIEDIENSFLKKLNEKWGISFKK